MRFLTFDIVESTNQEARRIAETGSLDTVWIRANEQTQGRGRRGRDWISAKGNLYCSGLYQHIGSSQSAALLSFVAALAVADVLETYIDRDAISLKWPNDVLINGKKTSGVLLEKGRTNNQDWIIIGIGINLVSSPARTEFPATHVLAHMADEDLMSPEPIMTGPDAALAVLARRFDYWRHILITQGFRPVRSEWLGRASRIPGPVRVRLTDEDFSGQALGLGENGELQVQLADGTIRDIHSGDVFFESR